MRVMGTEFVRVDFIFFSGHARWIIPRTRPVGNFVGHHEAMTYAWRDVTRNFARRHQKFCNTCVRSSHSLAQFLFNLKSFILIYYIAFLNSGTVTATNKVQQGSPHASFQILLQLLTKVQHSANIVACSEQANSSTQFSRERKSLRSRQAFSMLLLYVIVVATPTKSDSCATTPTKGSKCLMPRPTSESTSNTDCDISHLKDFTGQSDARLHRKYARVRELKERVRTDEVSTRSVNPKKELRKTSNNSMKRLTNPNLMTSHNPRHLHAHVIA
jgi:hypothetical protein